MQNVVSNVALSLNFPGILRTILILYIGCIAGAVMVRNVALLHTLPISMTCHFVDRLLHYSLYRCYFILIPKRLKMS